MTMVSEITSAFLDTISALFGGIADGLVNVFETMIYNDVDGLTVLGTWMLIFMGFSFAITIFYALFKKIA